MAAIVHDFVHIQKIYLTSLTITTLSVFTYDNSGLIMTLSAADNTVIFSTDNSDIFSS